MNENFFLNISSCSSIGVIFINPSFNSSSKKHDGIVIFHYVFKLVVHLFLVHMLDGFGDIFISPSMVWTSIFDKFFKYVCISSSMGWTYWIFIRPWFERCSNPLPRFLSRPIFGRVYLVMKGILAFTSVVQRLFSSME